MSNATFFASKELQGGTSQLRPAAARRPDVLAYTIWSLTRRLARKLARVAVAVGGGSGAGLAATMLIDVAQPACEDSRVGMAVPVHGGEVEPGFGDGQQARSRSSVEPTWGVTCSESRLVDQDLTMPLRSDENACKRRGAFRSLTAKTRVRTPYGP
jgi:hypothetical protein